MAGLGSSKKGNGKSTTYVSIVNGRIWDKTKGAEDENYDTEKYMKQDDDEGNPTGVRAGAAYGSIEGTVVGVIPLLEQKFGDYLCVKLDVNGESYTISAKRNTRTSQDLMKFLLMGDLNQEVLIKPYDFNDKETGRRVNGTNFFQGGEKIIIRDFVGNGMPVQDEDFWKNSTSRKIKKYFYDLDEWLGDEITERIEPMFAEKNDSEDESEQEAPKQDKKVEAKESEETKEDVKRPSVIAMKKVIKAYIVENYEGKTIPRLSKEEVAVWYDLALAEDELPFENEVASAEVSEDKVTDKLKNLLAD